MSVADLIEKLRYYRQDAPVEVIAHCRSYPFSLSFGNSDGATPKTADVVSFYVDELCTSESANKECK